MPFTWIDVLFVGLLIYFSVKGWTQGVLYLTASLIAFVTSLFLALKYAGSVSELLNTTFGFNNKWAGFIAYFLIAFSAEALISEFLSRALNKTSNTPIQNRANQFLGVFVSATSGLFLVSLFLFILLLIPIRGTVKDDIRSSFIAPRILSFIEIYGGALPKILKESAGELTQFMTVEPDSTERISLDLNVTDQDLTEDQKTEEMMFSLVNKERTSIGVDELIISQFMTEVAREYGKRMLLQRFFSHYDTQGYDVGDRLTDVGVRFGIAGENLAYAPDLPSAHEGLMNSAGHRRNILDARFHKIGIGVIDAGIWGKMFVQVFGD